MKKWILVLLLIIASFAYCINKKKKLQKLAVNYEKTDFIDFDINHKYLVTEVEIDRVKVGDSYKSHKKKLKEIENKEGHYRAFNLHNSDKENIALVYIDPYDQKTISTIEILSSKYKTEKGVGVGSTFKEIKESYPKSETHGSEIAGRTLVMAGDYHFLLEKVIFHSYSVDESKIHPSTRIKKIILRK